MTMKEILENQLILNPSFPLGGAESQILSCNFDGSSYLYKDFFLPLKEKENKKKKMMYLSSFRKELLHNSYAEYFVKDHGYLMLKSTLKPFGFYFMTKEETLTLLRKIKDYLCMLWDRSIYYYDIHEDNIFVGEDLNYLFLDMDNCEMQKYPCDLLNVDTRYYQKQTGKLGKEAVIYNFNLFAMQEFQPFLKEESKEIKQFQKKLERMEVDGICSHIFFTDFF